MRALLLAALLPTMVGMGEAEANDYPDDYTPRSMFPGVVCEDDWHYAEIPAKLKSGECWEYVPRTDLSEGR